MIEGRGFGGNDEELRALRAANTNPNIQFIEVLDAGHFSVLAPMNEIIARAILADTGPTPSIALSETDIAAAFRPQARVQPSPPLVRRPTQENLEAHYPPAARQAGLDGSATVACIVQADFHLGQCEVITEDPPGQGFSEAAITIMQTYIEVAPQTADGTSTVGGRLQRRFYWLN